MWFDRVLHVLTGALITILFLGAAKSCSAHTLKPGECVAYASDVVRFMAVKAEGYSADEASEGLRLMFQDGTWFDYVRDKEDVQRLRDVLPRIWALPPEANAEQIYQDTLINCDPDTDEQFRLQGEPKCYHGM